MIRRLFQYLRIKRVPRFVRDREIRRVVRQLPVLGLPRPTSDGQLEFIADMVKNHSFLVRNRRLYYRYLNGKMERAKCTAYQQMLEDRKLIVTNSFGTQFHVDRTHMSRALDTCERIANESG